jgi:murein L,D-transpeptidase YcbB/YkuD
MLPRIERDPDYLARNRYVVVGGDGDDGAELLEGLRSGRLGLRQLPGPGNALGAVKFLFPNADQVYLHDTSAPEVFERPRRDASSGCVRVRDSAGLALWVLRNNPAWPEERIRAALEGGPGDVVARVDPPMPVYLIYVTVVVNEQREVHFFEDIYGHDARLLQALQRDGGRY